MKRALTNAYFCRFSRMLGAALLCALAQTSAHAAPLQPAHRVVSLIPSLTEDLCRVGAGAQIVGVSQYSEDIPCVRGVAQVGGFSSIDVERIIALHPDAVVAIPSQKRLAEPLERAGISVRYYRDDAFDDIFTDLQAVGALTGHSREASDAVRSLRAQTRALQRSMHARNHPRVFVALGPGPIWTVGPSSYIATMLRLAGAENAVRSLPAAYGQYSAEALVRLDPDAILTDKDTGVQAVLDREPWRSLRAVRNHHVFVMTNPSIVERPGPRYNEGLRWLIDALEPLER